MRHWGRSAWNTYPSRVNYESHWVIFAVDATTEALTFENASTPPHELERWIYAVQPSINTNHLKAVMMPTIRVNIWRQFLRIKAKHFFSVVLCADHGYHNKKVLKNNEMCLIYPCSLTLKFPCLFHENGWNARKAVKKYVFPILIATFSFSTPKN